MSLQPDGQVALVGAWELGKQYCRCGNMGSKVALPVAAGAPSPCPVPHFTPPRSASFPWLARCRLEVRCAAHEVELKELRKSQKETVSELKLEHNNIKQSAYEVREAAERRQQQLGEALAAAEAQAAGLEEAATAAGKAAEGAQRSVGRLERQLAELQGEHAELQAQHDKVGGDRAAGSPDWPGLESAILFSL